jgi:hypothetical protein
MKRTAYLFVAILLVGASAVAQTFRPFTELRVIRTKRFDIIFSERSRPTAERVASFADDLYDRASSLLDIRVRGRIPVTITPDSEGFNGYMNAFPYPHIVLFDTSMDIELTTYGDPIESLFFHELVHAVSMSSRGPAFDFLSRIFGAWIMPIGLTAPFYMIEGVTVSFESLDGFGRANDPLIRERVAQAAVDGVFQTPFQASGIHDRPFNGNTPYEYGGLFSAYLQKRWGMDAYAKLWKEMGTRVPLSLSFYKHGFYRIFKDVYGIPLVDAWADFAAELAVPGLEDNRENLLVGGEFGFDLIVSGGGRLFFPDAVEGRLCSYDPKSGTRSKLFPIDSTVSDIDVSGDGRRILIASYRFDMNLATAVVEEYETQTGNRTGRSWKSMYRPRYFRDGIVGVSAELHRNRIVFRDGAGKETVLLPEGDGILYSAPAPIDEDRIACIVSEKGVRRIIVFDASSGEAARLKTDLPDDAERFRYARDLRFRDGTLFFSYTKAGGFYKLAAIDENGIVFSERQFSGGIFSATQIEGTVYYRGAFSPWDSVLRYPEKAADIAGKRAAIALGESWPAAESPAQIGPSDKTEHEENRYSPLSYLDPSRFWIPYPLLRSSGNTLRNDGFGIVSYLSDPLDANTLFLTAGFDTAGNLGMVEIDWTTLSLGTPINAVFSDKIEFDASTGLDDPYRATRAAVNASFLRGIRGERNTVELQASASSMLHADDPKDGSDAYAWDYEDPRYAIGFSAGLSSLRRPAWRLFGSGAELVGRCRLALPATTYRTDTVLRAAFEPLLPVRIAAYAVFDEGGAALDGSSVTYGEASFEGMSEYADEAPSELKLLAGVNTELRLFSMETQSNISHLYFNRLFGTLSFRGAAYDSDGGAHFVQSLMLRAGAVASALPLAFLPVRFSPHFWAAWKLSNLDDANAGNDYAFGFTLDLAW